MFSILIDVILGARLHNTFTQTGDLPYCSDVHATSACVCVRINTLLKKDGKTRD